MGTEHGAVEHRSSIWIRPERAARGPSPEHSRAKIAAAAVSIADDQGISAVTMRSVAAAISSAPASLYRYVLTRDELVELMADYVYGEFGYDRPASGDPFEDLLRIARQGRAIYLRHPWLLEVMATESLPGPNALVFIEQTLAALGPTGLDGPAKLETVGLFSGALRLTAQAEIGQQRAGQDAAEWQRSMAAYLLKVATDGRHPNLATAIADQPADSRPTRADLFFERAMARILNGLLA
jgi:AcrR family transcriptional regulator